MIILGIVLYLSKVSCEMGSGWRKFNPLAGEPSARCVIDSHNCDAAKSTEAILCLSSESPDKVDERIRNAVAASGTDAQHRHSR
jgi:hypothetical protein